MFMYIFMCIITCKMAVRIWLKIGRHDNSIIQSLPTFKFSLLTLKLSQMKFAYLNNVIESTIYKIVYLCEC